MPTTTKELWINGGVDKFAKLWTNRVNNDKNR